MSATIDVRRDAQARDETSYDFWMAVTPFESTTGGEFWLVNATTLRQLPDHASDLRKQVLSYRAERPRDSSLAEAVIDALGFIDLIPATATLPQVALADDGEINFFWRSDGLLIDIGFVGDGMMHYYVSDETQGVDVDDSVQFSGRSLPRDIQMTMPSGRFGTYAYGRV